jgi:hypothetical protein
VTYFSCRISAGVVPLSPRAAFTKRFQNETDVQVWPVNGWTVGRWDEAFDLADTRNTAGAPFFAKGGGHERLLAMRCDRETK